MAATCCCQISLGNTIKAWLPFKGVATKSVASNVMQTVIDFSPVFLSRSCKYCLWSKSKPLTLWRSYSSCPSGLHNLRQVVQWLGEHAPVFAVDGNNIAVLREPKEFFETLKDNVRKAKRRIVLASLYLGTGVKEQQLVDCIYEAMEKSTLSARPLDVEILLEHTRGSRGKPNSRTMLLPLVQKFSNSVKVSLYHTPSLRGLLKLVLPQRFNETVALTHLKVYLTDDSIIMSGANLSADYFTNRQDRYIEIKNCPRLADYFHRLVSTVRGFSLHLQPDNTTKMAENFPVHPTEGYDGGKKFKAEAGNRVSEYLEQQKEENVFSEIADKSKQHFDTWVVPLVQMFAFGIRQDEFVTAQLLGSASQCSRLYLASGYFNLTRKYINIMLKSSAHCEILTAHPTVNGFYGAKGVAGGIPHGYTLIARDFYNLVCKHNRTKYISVHEYQRDKWTFHVKGLWYYPPHGNMPILTLIGSPNFGHRSVYRDLEAQVAIVTSNPDVCKALDKEKTDLYSCADRVDIETFKLPERRPPLWVSFITRFAKNLF